MNPRPFIKPATAIIGTNDPILIPPDSDTLDYEIEIAAVIGKPDRHIAVDQADDHVAGYVVFNDVSARSLKIAEGRTTRAGDDFFDWLLGKWCDSFAAIGPYLVTRDEAGDPNALEMALRVNGELRQHSDAGEMIFSIAESIAFLSRFVTLRAGDLLCMGHTRWSWGDNRYLPQVRRCRCRRNREVGDTDQYRSVTLRRHWARQRSPQPGRLGKCPAPDAACDVRLHSPRLDRNDWA
ncbi:MAG: fumarylacetoacetate hydrolase family protein [Thermomicrobiales bacterium]